MVVNKLKQYNIIGYSPAEITPAGEIRMDFEESSRGEWIRADDALARIAELEDDNKNLQQYADDQKRDWVIRSRNLHSRIAELEAELKSSENMANAMLSDKDSLWRESNKQIAALQEMGMKDEKRAREAETERDTLKAALGLVGELAASSNKALLNAPKELKLLMTENNNVGDMMYTAISSLDRVRFILSTTPEPIAVAVEKMEGADERVSNPYKLPDHFVDANKKEGDGHE